MCLFVFQLMLIIGLAHVLVVFRVVAAPLLSEGRLEFFRDHANTVAMMLGAVLHYVTIQIMTRVSFPQQYSSMRNGIKDVFPLFNKHATHWLWMNYGSTARTC